VFFGSGGVAKKRMVCYHDDGWSAKMKRLQGRKNAKKWNAGQKTLFGLWKTLAASTRFDP
jgi:hypothetical protein